MPESPHDKLFKAAFGDPFNAAAELRSILPATILAQADLQTLSPLPGSFVDEALAGSESDLLYSLRIAGKGTLLYVLFEHKSQPNRWGGFQLLRYVVRIYERCLSAAPRPEYLPLVIPVLVHHSDGGFRHATDFVSLLDPGLDRLPELAAYVPRFRFFLDDISGATDAELRQRAFNAFGALAVLFLRDARSPERFLARLPAWADLLHRLHCAPDGERALTLLFHYIYKASQLDRDSLRNAVRKAIPPAEELIMTLAEQLQHEGFQQGLQQGRELGLEQGRELGLEQGRELGLELGRRRLLLELLEGRFGQLTEDALARLERADEAALHRYAQRLLTAASLDDVFAA